MTDVATWFAEHTTGAPGALRARAAHYLGAVSGSTPHPEALAAAGALALAAVVADGRDRAAALDLLAADGLVTLALLAQASEAPDALGRFAEHLVHDTAA